MLVALVVQHSMLMCPITLPPVAFLAVPHFSALSHKQQDFRGGKKVIANKMHVLISCTQLLYETFYIIGRTERDLIKKIGIGTHVKYPLFLSKLN